MIGHGATAISTAPRSLGCRLKDVHLTIDVSGSRLMDAKPHNAGSGNHADSVNT